MKRLKVYLTFNKNSETLVGELAENNHTIYFQYDSSFVDSPYNLSPYKLPLTTELIEFKDLDFGPIFGLFDDSLPDGWGLMLMDRYLKSKGFTIEELSILDRLAFIGNNTMGALTYKPVLEVKAENSDSFNLHNLFIESQNIITGKTETVLDELMRVGGSPGGARPKVLVGVGNNCLISGEGILPDIYEHWIIKFCGQGDLKESGLIEYVYSFMAKECGIDIPETKLFTTDKGDIFFGIKRFDRGPHNSRYHTHTLGNLIHSNFRIPSCDYETLFKVISSLTNNYQDLLKGFRQMVFNVFTHNRDDHVKNFSFIMNQKGVWSLSPAYDLTFSNGPRGEHSMTIDGEGKSPTINNMLNVGKNAGIKKNDCETIIKQITKVVSNWPKYAKKYDISSKTIDIISGKIIK
ncbi:MAG: type II toxin-antitoxin system HipA family toxin [Spirochaetaceae bacterium]